MDPGGEYRAEDDNGDRYECTGDWSKCLRFLESSQWQNRGWSKKLIGEKKKHMCSIWYFCTAVTASFCWLEEKYKQQVGCFNFDYIATEEIGTCLSPLPCIIYSLPPQLVAENYFCTISPTFPLIFYNLYSTVLLSWMHQ